MKCKLSANHFRVMKTLFNNEIESVYVAAMLDTRRESNENGYPVKIRIAFQSKRTYYSTGKYLTLAEWEYITTNRKDLSNEEKTALDEIKKSIKRSSNDMKTIKDDIEGTFERIKAEVKSLVVEGSFSFDNLNKRIKKSTSDIINIAFNTKINKLTEDGQIGTAVSYKCALSSIVSFRGSSIPFDNVTVDWLKKYERKLLIEGKSQTTIGFYTRCIRAILNDAITAGTIRQNQYPFGSTKNGLYEIKTGESRKLALTIDQIKKVVNYTDGFEGTERYRDLFYFSLLCNGANFTDILHLKYSNISNGEITFVRQKTARTSKVKKNIVATLTPAMQTIINQYGNPNKPGNFIFPYIKGNETPEEKKMKVQDIVARTNKRLSKIGEALEIEGITTYAARHSYANILLHGNAPIALIADQLGHTNISTTQAYLAGFDKDERKKYSDLFSDL